MCGAVQNGMEVYINLITILDVYLSEEITTDKPYLVKDGMKIIL